MSSDFSSYFKNRNDLGLEIVECILCETVLSSDNLKKHLTDVHGIRLKAVEEFEIEGTNIETGDREDTGNIVVSGETSNLELIQTKNKTNIWRYFFKLTNDRWTAQCLICDGLYSFKTTTGNLSAHLKKRHTTAFLEYRKLVSGDEVDLADVCDDNDNTAKGDRIEIEAFNDKDDGEKDDEVPGGGNDSEKKGDVIYLVKTQQRQNRSTIWKFFSKLSHEEFKAQCSVCDGIFSYRGTTGNLRVHLEKKHPTAYLQLLKFINLGDEDELTFSDVENVDADKSARDETSEVEENSGKDDGEIDDDDADPDYVNASEKKGDVIYLVQPRKQQQRNIVWNFFSQLPYADFKAQCSICDCVLSYKSTTGNLRKHIEKRHPVAYEKFKKIKKLNGKDNDVSTDDDSDEEVKVKYASEYTDDFGNLVFAEPKKRKNLSFLWKYFNKIAYENSKAQCSLCGTMLSFKSTTGNLSHHLMKQHPIAYKDYQDLKESASKELVSNVAHAGENKRDKHGAKVQSKRGDASETEENFDKGSETRHQNSDSEHDDDFADLMKPLKPKKKLIPSTVWRHVFKVTGDESRVRCSICDMMISCQTGWCGNLRLHLQKRHPIAYAEFEKKYLNEIGENDSNDPLTIDENDDKARELEEFIDDFGNKIQLVNPKPRKNTSVIWRYFSKESEEEFKARCLTCGGMFSYKESANLLDHLEKRHSKVYMEYKSVKSLIKNDEEALNTGNYTDDFGNVIFAENKEKKNQSHLWMFFSKLSYDKFKAQCSLCSAILSFKSSRENLLLHLVKKHPEAHRNVLELRHLTGDNAAENQDTFVFDDDYEAEEAVDDVWSFFEKETGGRARCIVCRNKMSQQKNTMLSHLKEQHPSLVGMKEEVDQNSEPDEDDNPLRSRRQSTFKEVVYVAEPTMPKPFRKRPTEHSTPIAKKIKTNLHTTNEKTDDNSDAEDEELTLFLKYIKSLLKKVPREVSSKLQMDIINLIMNAKLNHETKQKATNSFSIDGRKITYEILTQSSDVPTKYVIDLPSTSVSEPIHTNNVESHIENTESAPTADVDDVRQVENVQESVEKV